MRRFNRLAAGLLVTAFALAAQNVTAQVTFKHGALTIVQGAKRVTLQVEVADTPMARAQGLMYRTHLDEHAGMLFIHESLESGSYWMKNTLIPLSIAFIDEKWFIVDIKDMKVAPDPALGPFEFYPSAKPFHYALEVNQGFFTRRGITRGARVNFTLK